ncbi:methyl-CpG-binding domain protein 1a isoform 2-T2 [Odontesthes bonariensis]
MNYEQLDELCLGAGLEVGEVPGPPEAERRRPTRKCSNARSAEEKEAEEEQRWRQLFPDIKQCTILIARPRPEQLRAWRGRGQKLTSCDLRPGVEGLQPPDGDGRSQSYVKKVEVKVQAAPDSGPGKPCRRLRLRPDVTASSAHRRPHGEDGQMDHTYCREDSDTQSDCSSQSQDTRPSSGSGHRDEDYGCLSAEKKNPPSIVFQKVGGHQWVLRSPEVREEEEEEEMRKKKRTKDLMPEAPTRVSVRRPRRRVRTRKVRRRRACGECAACLRNSCGRCQFCLDMRRFGGPSKLKQKCVQRRCLMVNTRKRNIMELPDGIQEEVTVTTATDLQLHHWKRWRKVKQLQVEPSPWGSMWGGQMLMLKNNTVRTELMNGEEEQKEQRGRSQYVCVQELRQKPEQRTERREAKGSDGFTEVLIKKEEEEQKDETQTQFWLAGGGGPSPHLSGTHVQLNLTLDGSHLSPSFLSDSALTCLSGLLPQEGSVLHVSKGLTFIPPPPPVVPPLQPKEEEEEPVEIQLCGAGGGVMKAEPEEVEVCSEGVSERGKFYQVEVELPGSDSDEETLTASPPSDITEAVTAKAADDVTACDVILLGSGSFSLFGGGVRDGVPGGRSLLHLQRALKRTVLPAHWVSVLADGPVLQLLQCSKLSSMTDTVVHIRPDLRLYISVQNRLLPETHRVYRERPQGGAHLSQLVSLLLHLERMTVCRGSRVRSLVCPQPVRSAACQLLVAPPSLTCLPCLMEEEEEEGEEEEEEEEEKEEVEEES